MPADQRDDPYRLAVAIQDYLRDPSRFTYDTDVRGACPSDIPVSECLLRTGRGYCQHFATAMVMMLRTRSVPARFVQGYLPGRRVVGGSWEVDRGSLHAWVEVFFPDHGWVRFDPTPGQEERGSRPTRLEEGPVVPEPTLIPEGTLGPDETPPDGGIEPSPEPSPTPDATIAASTGPTDVPGIVLLAAGLLAVALVLAAAVVIRLRRLPAPEADQAYQRVAAMAARLGMGPGPAQTTYEYMAGLSESLPSVRQELAVVAQARVESRYAGRRAQGAGLAALRAAYRRVRMALVRAFLRRPRPRG
jgi:hypothetical protein